MNSPFLLWKRDLDILAIIFFNVCNKFILPMVLSDIQTDCRNYTVCTTKDYLSLRTDKIS